jgi:GDP-L-fucose synthase
MGTRSGNPSQSFWIDRKVTVTGGTGFLGESVCQQLRSVGAEVRALGTADFDLTRPEEATAAVERSSVVIHLAANVGGIGYNQRSPGPLIRDNVQMGINVFEACRIGEVDRLVAVCSVCAYPGEASVPFREDELFSGYPEGTNAPYGIAKRMLVTLSDAYRRQWGLDSRVPIVANLYGPGDSFDLEDSHVIPAMIRKFIEASDRGDREVVLWGSGKPSREFLHVADAARAVILGAEVDRAERPFNVGTGVETRIRDLASMVAEVVGFDGEIAWDPSRPDGQLARYLDVERARETIGFEARVGLREGIAETVEWYRANARSLPPDLDA